MGRYLLFSFLNRSLFLPILPLHTNDSVPQRISTPHLHFLGKLEMIWQAAQVYKENTDPWIPTPKPQGTPPGPVCFALQLFTRRWQQRAPKRVSQQVTGAEAQLLAGVPERGLQHPPPGIHIQPGRPLRLKYFSFEIVSDPFISWVKTNNSLKQQRQLIASLLPPVPNFPTNSSSNPAPFPEQGLFRNSLRSGPCTSSGAGCRAAGSASATAASLLLRPVCHAGFPAGRDARAALLFHHPSSFPNPPLRPFSPKHTQAHKLLGRA